MFRTDVTLRPPTIVEDTCYENGNIFTIDNQCRKRKCTIPRGYKITKGEEEYVSGEDEIAMFDYDLYDASVFCDFS